MDPSPHADDARLTRKSVYGRTSLFLPSPGIVLRNVNCITDLKKDSTTSVYHQLRSWDKRESSCCWHCCDPFEWDAYPAPRLFDPTEMVYHVYGVFCSPACIKGYILEHTSFDRGTHLNTMTKMLRDVYGITEFVKEAPPRIALKKFGGVYDIADFRGMRNECTICTPPFVSYCMIVQEAAPTARTDTVHGAPHLPPKPRNSRPGRAHGASAGGHVRRLPQGEGSLLRGRPSPPCQAARRYEHRQPRQVRADLVTRCRAWVLTVMVGNTVSTYEKKTMPTNSFFIRDTLSTS